MRSKTQQNLENAGNDAKVDEAATNLLQDPDIFAGIARFVVPELQKLPASKVRKLIIGTPQVKSVPIFPDERLTATVPAAITDKTQTEGTVSFDVYGEIQIPANLRTSDAYASVRVVLNLEPQGKETPWKRIDYHIQYTGCRLVSMQHKNFPSPHFELLVPVYTVWIMLNPPKGAENTIELYRLVKVPYAGPDKSVDPARTSKAARSEESQESKPNIKELHSLMNILIVRIGDPETAKTQLLRLLDVIFALTLEPSAKGNILASEFDIPKSSEMENSLMAMGALSTAIRDRVTESVTESVTKSVTESVTKSVTDSVTKSVTESVTKSVTDSVTKSVTKSVTDAVRREDAVAVIKSIHQNGDSRENALQFLLRLAWISPEDAQTVVSDVYGASSPR